MEIKGKVFIVTGGASGLGEGTARMLALRGGTVVIADMQVEKGEAVAKEIGGAFVRCDVSNEADAQAVVDKAVSLGKLMGLVNCAGIAPAEKTVGKNGAHSLALFSGWFGSLLQGSARAQRWLNRATGLVLIGLAVRLVSLQRGLLYSGGADGTRTRDPRRDRPVF